MAGRFQYTLNEPSKGILTAEQRAFYEENGYLVIPKLVSTEALLAYKQRFIDICSGDAPTPAYMTVMRDISTAGSKVKGEQGVTKVQDYIEDPVLFSYCKEPALLNYVKCFTGENILATHTMLINKPPGVGSTSRHPLHQDLLYFPFRPADRIVCSWTAMEPVHRDNGCLVVIPGSHKGELLPHGYPDWKEGVNKAYFGVRDLSEQDYAKRVHLPMQPGDTVFFHPILIHGSGTNRTAGYRKAISCHFSTATCDFINVAGTLQEELAQEIGAMFQKKMGYSLPPEEYYMLWKFKSRLVSGRSSDPQFMLQ